MESWLIPAAPVTVVEEIKKSRFITLLAHTDGVAAAKAFVESVRADHPDARHHCVAWVAGPPDDSQQLGFSDDGEPAGTAGKPMLDKSTWTREIIERNGTFGIVVPGVAAASWTYAVGSVSGRDEDKFNAWGIPVVTGPELGLPLIEEKCLAWMECRLLPATAAQTQYDTLFGEVVSAAADERAFVTGRWQFDDDKLNTLHHLGTGNFVASGRHVRANSLDE